jgi:hypothetical protein
VWLLEDHRQLTVTTAPVPAWAGGPSACGSSFFVLGQETSEARTTPLGKPLHKGVNAPSASRRTITSPVTAPRRHPTRAAQARLLEEVSRERAPTTRRRRRPGARLACSLTQSRLSYVGRGTSHSPRSRPAADRRVGRSDMINVGEVESRPVLIRCLAGRLTGSALGAIGRPHICPLAGLSRSPRTARLSTSAASADLRPDQPIFSPTPVAPKLAGIEPTRCSVSLFGLIGSPSSRVDTCRSRFNEGRARRISCGACGFRCVARTDSGRSGDEPSPRRENKNPMRSHRERDDRYGVHVSEPSGMTLPGRLHCVHCVASRSISLLEHPRVRRLRRGHLPTGLRRPE